MPRGKTLRSLAQPRGSWIPFSETDARQFPDLFEDKTDEELPELRRASIVVREVFSLVPRVERHGLPTFARDEKVHKWVHDDMGWGFLASTDGETLSKRFPAVECNFHDTGDDSVPRIWMEVSIEPTLAEKLDHLLLDMPEFDCDE